MDAETRCAAAEAAVGLEISRADTLLGAIVILMRRAGLSSLNVPYTDEWLTTSGAEVEVSFTDDDEVVITIVEPPGDS